jgi:hypothetical protein
MLFGRAAVGVIVALLVGISSPAQAKQHRWKVIVLDLPTVAKFDDATNKILNDFFATDLRQQGLEVITRADVQAALGIERQKELLGCNDTQCLADLGGAMGSDYIASGSVAVLDDETAISLQLIDTRGVEVNRVGARAKGKSASALLSLLEVLATQLVQPLRDQKKLAAADASPAGALTTPSPPAEGGNPAPWRLAGYLTGGAGLALGLSALLPWRSSNILYAQVANGSLASGATMANRLSQGNTDRYVAGGLLAGGVVGLGIGLSLVLTHLDTAPGAVSIQLSPVRPGVLASVDLP